MKEGGREGGIQVKTCKHAAQLDIKNRGETDINHSNGEAKIILTAVQMITNMLTKMKARVITRSVTMNGCKCGRGHSSLNLRKYLQPMLTRCRPSMSSLAECRHTVGR